MAGQAAKRRPVILAGFLAGTPLNDRASPASRGVKQLTYGGGYIVLRLPMGT
jgi:hypothetical protein